MKEFWWKLPVLRGLTPMRRGFVEAVAIVSAASGLVVYSVSVFFSSPSPEVFSSFAQIGATLLVAYAVQTAWVLQSSRKRGANRENWVGMATGLGSCTLLGIVIALLLSDQHGSLTLLEEVGFAWVVVSIGLLGLWIALQPWAVYEWTHWFNTEYPDE